MFSSSSIKKVINTAMHQNGKWTSAPRVLKGKFDCFLFGLVCGSYFLLIREHIRHVWHLFSPTGILVTLKERGYFDRVFYRINTYLLLYLNSQCASCTLLKSILYLCQ